MDYGRGHHQSARVMPEEGPAFVYTAANRATLDEIFTRYPSDQRKSAILAALYLAQAQQGHITRNAIRHVADVIGCTPADVEDVVSFYTMFYTRPVGRHVIQVCRTLSCALMGAERVTEALSHTLGIQPGETDKAGESTLLEVECSARGSRAVIGVNDHCTSGRIRSVQVLVDACAHCGEAAAVTGWCEG